MSENMQYEINFSGHINVTSLHQKTIEITKEKSLGPNGDCIIGVNASAGCNDIPQNIKKLLKNPDSKVTITITVGSSSFEILGSGHSELLLTDPDDIVIRKSDFICPRTLAIKCNYAADSIPRNLINNLKNSKTRGKFLITVSTPN